MARCNTVIAKLYSLLIFLTVILKIASLLKIPFLDEEAPTNTFPRKVYDALFSYTLSELFSFVWFHVYFL